MWGSTLYLNSYQDRLACIENERVRRPCLQQNAEQNSTATIVGAGTTDKLSCPIGVNRRRATPSDISVVAASDSVRHVETVLQHTLPIVY